MTTQPIFSTNRVIWLLAIGVFSFAGAAYFLIYGDDHTARTTDANSFSYSAIGHKAFVETLRRLDLPVLVSRHNSAAKAGRSALLVVAEPDTHWLADDANEELLAAKRILLVLPKWGGERDDAKPRWIGSVASLPPDEVERVLRLAVSNGRVLRASRPVVWNRNQFDVAPTLSTPQLVKARALIPIVASDEGLLVGEVVRGGQTIWVLSDPDILANHGLGRGDIAVVAIFVLLWAAVGRFGMPIRSEPPHEPGKAGLIENTARLLQYRAHGPEILGRYLRVTLRDAGRRLHAPRHLDDDALAEWLIQAGTARGVRDDIRSLRREIDAVITETSAEGSRATRAAQKLHSWKREIVHGSGHRSIAQPPPQGAG
jgi:hypothetical protein